MRGTVKQDTTRKTWYFVIDNGVDPEWKTSPGTAARIQDEESR